LPAAGLTLNGIARAIKLSLARTLGAASELVWVEVRSTGGRRLQGNESTTASEDFWEADYEVKIPLEQVNSDSFGHSVDALLQDNASLGKELQAALIEEGADEIAMQQHFSIVTFTAKLTQKSNQTSTPFEETSDSAMPTVSLGIAGASAALLCIASCS